MMQAHRSDGVGFAVCMLVVAIGRLGGFWRRLCSGIPVSTIN